MGWAVGFVRSYMHETGNGSALGVNKERFSKFAQSFPVICDAVKFGGAVDNATKKAKDSGDDGCRLLEFGEYRRDVLERIVQLH